MCASGVATPSVIARCRACRPLWAGPVCSVEVRLRDARPEDCWSGWRGVLLASAAEGWAGRRAGLVGSRGATSLAGVVGWRLVRRPGLIGSDTRGADPPNRSGVVGCLALRRGDSSTFPLGVGFAVSTTASGTVSTGAVHSPVPPHPAQDATTISPFPGATALEMHRCVPSRLRINTMWLRLPVKIQSKTPSPSVPTLMRWSASSPSPASAWATNRRRESMVLTWE
mmetsp:Transcript_52796/g.140355  ORF Transcript_52796/g.140355 Transcript_52796/m.140355 type:complete len:226 (-) Transcript_52796:1106-1783(-)